MSEDRVIEAVLGTAIDEDTGALIIRLQARNGKVFNLPLSPSCAALVMAAIQVQLARVQAGGNGVVQSLRAVAVDLAQKADDPSVYALVVTIEGGGELTIDLPSDAVRGVEWPAGQIH